MGAACYGRQIPGAPVNLLPNPVQSMTRNKMRGVQQGVLVRAATVEENVLFPPTKLLWACNAAQNRFGQATLCCGCSVWELTTLLHSTSLYVPFAREERGSWGGEHEKRMSGSVPTDINSSRRRDSSNRGRNRVTAARLVACHHRLLPNLVPSSLLPDFVCGGGAKAQSLINSDRYRSKPNRAQQNWHEMLQ